MPTKRQVPTVANTEEARHLANIAYRRALETLWDADRNVARTRRELAVARREAFEGTVDQRWTPDGLPIVPKHDYALIANYRMALSAGLTAVQLAHEAGLLALDMAGANRYAAAEEMRARQEAERRRGAPLLRRAPGTWRPEFHADRPPEWIKPKNRKQ